MSGFIVNQQQSGFAWRSIRLGFNRRDPKGVHLAEDPQLQAKAEQFADRMEAQMRSVSTGDFFCDSQRVRWRQHSIRAYLGLSPDPEAEPSQG